MTPDLFAELETGKPCLQTLALGAMLLREFATDQASELLTALQPVLAQAPLRQMQTPGGYTMSAAMSNCGVLGWVTDQSGYRYSPTDPQTGLPWPPMPESLRQLAVAAASTAGFSDFNPDACLINRYDPGARMSLHQDKDEADLSQPIVSVSLGIPAVFLFGGLMRSDKTEKFVLKHGDVVVWGGPARLRYHGIQPLKPNHHPLVGDYRLNLTFRRATP